MAKKTEHTYIAEPLRSLAVPIADLKPDASNARKHGPRNLETIKNSLDRWGQRQPIVVQRDGMIVRAGNGRLEAAKSLGWTHMAALVVDDTSTEAVAFAIADNRTSDLAEWDTETLASLLQSLDDEDRDAAGYDDGELDALLAELTPAVEVQEDEAPEPPADPVTRYGDLWSLGGHRVLCGDSTEANDWERLGIRDRCVCFTSPPYNLGAAVSLGHNKNLGSNAYDKMDDNQNPADWSAMVDATLTHAMAHCEAAVYNVQPLAGNRRELLRWIADRDEFRDIATWDKGHAAPQIAAGVMASRFEWLIVFGRGKSTRRVPLSSWQGTVQSVYAGPPQRNNEHAAIHGATFPVHLPSWVIAELCNTAAAVVDCFMGTGTTLIAAEQLGRTCYGIEISPAYVDVIVRRWEKFTGNKATRVDADGNPAEPMPEEEAACA